MKKIKSVVSKLLVTVLAASFALMLPGCADAESVLPEYTDDKTMTLGAWGAPPPTKEGYETFAAAGFNCAFQDFRQLTSSALHDVMRYAEETGVKMWIQTGNESYNQPDIIQKVYDEELDQYDSFDGINFYDEPGAVRFEEIAELIPDFEKNYSDGMFIVNLFPSYADGSYLGAGGFEGYINNYVEKVLGARERPQIPLVRLLSFDDGDRPVDGKIRKLRCGYMAVGSRHRFQRGEIYRHRDALLCADPQIRQQPRTDFGRGRKIPIRGVDGIRV